MEDAVTQEAARQAGEEIGTAAATGLVNFFIFMFCAGIFWGIACSYFAGRRGRNVGAGFFAGFFFHIFGLIYYVIAGDSIEMRVMKEEKARAKYRKLHNSAE